MCREINRTNRNWDSRLQLGHGTTLCSAICKNLRHRTKGSRPPSTQHMFTSFCLRVWLPGTTNVFPPTTCAIGSANYETLIKATHRTFLAYLYRKKGKAAPVAVSLSIPHLRLRGAKTR